MPPPKTTPTAQPPAVADGLQRPTPENTPLPGGGRWRWDDAATAWVPADAVTAAQIAQPASEKKE